MKYLADKVTLAGKEYRIIADTESSEVEVWGSDLAWEFQDRTAAYSYVARAYKTAQDLRNIAPGQEVVLTMADGQQKKVNVLNNDTAQVTVVDDAGRQFNIPHMQAGATPRILPPKRPETPAQSGQEGGPEIEQGEAKNIEPGTGTSYASKQAALPKLHFCPRCNTSRSLAPGEEKHYAIPLGSGRAKVVKYLSCGHPVDVGAGETGATWKQFANKNPLSKKQAEFPHRHPQHCKHDGTYLQRKDPSDPEKACPQCGMVYEAAVDPALVTKPPKSGPMIVKKHPKFRLNKERGKEHYRSTQFPYAEKGKNVDVTAATFNPFDKPPVFPEGKPKVESRPYRCKNCGNEQMITTNHLGDVIDYCRGCSWKPSYGNPDYAVPYGGRTYRPFEYAGPTERTVLQRRNAGCDSDYFVEGDHCDCPVHKKKIALSKNGYHWQVGDLVKFSHPTLGVVPGKVIKDEGSQYIIRHGEELLAVPHQYILGPQLSARRKTAQPLPSGPPGKTAPPSSPPISTEQTAPTQVPAGDQPQPQRGAGPGRPLSRHEIITEAEILIRNALHKGVRIGTWDLVEYMRQNYSNPPEELYEGATKAWEKVQWEEQEAFEVSKGPGPQQKKQPGLEPQEAPNPVQVEDIAQRPLTGPKQVKV